MTPSKVTAHEFQSILDELPDQDIAVRVLKRWASIPAVAGEQQLDRKGRFLKVVDEEKSAAWDAKKHPAASESQEYLTRFSSAALSGPDFMAQVIERPAAILGDGVFSEYQLGIFAGRGGVGKTWVSLQLALSLARGEPFFGLATPAGGIRVGVVELEDHASNYQDRLRTLSGDFPVPENLRILARPFLAGAVAILDDKARAGLIHWIREDGIRVVLMDPLKNLHKLQENDTGAMGAVCSAFWEVIHTTGAGILVNHHEPKPTTDGRERDDQASVRGAAILTDDIRFGIRLKAHGGLFRLTTFKTSHGARPEPIWLAQESAGPFKQVDDPGGVSDANQEKVAQAITGVYLSREEIEKATGLAKPTVTKYLKLLSATTDGRSRCPKYTLATTRLSPTTQEPVVDGSTNGDSKLRLIE